jgi:hypothetical protein
VQYPEDMEHIPRMPRNTNPMTGHLWVHDVLAGHPSRCYDEFRLSKQCFHALVEILSARQLLKDTRNTTVREQLAIVFSILGHGGSNRHVMEWFQHSGETISRYFNKGLKAIVALKKDFIRQLRPDAPVPEKIASQIFTTLTRSMKFCNICNCSVI